MNGDFTSAILLDPWLVRDALDPLKTWWWHGRLIALALAGAACSSTLPPLPEIVVIADTNLPVPLAVSRLRADLFDERGTWFESADFARPDPHDWPASFSVYSDDPSRPRKVWVRLRAYLDGHTRAYRGDPRLVKDGKDVTPDTTPDPMLSVDRLILLELLPDQKRFIHVLLDGSCIGAPARFGDDPTKPVLGQAASCVDTEMMLAPVDVADLESENDARPSQQGSWLHDTCPASPSSDVVCVPGGATILGSKDLLASIEIAAQPERVFGVHTFFLDRFEVTVGRFRKATQAGFTAKPMPLANNGPLGETGNPSCTWSTAAMDREDDSLNCVVWSTARAFCKFIGGDLPTELQWEHAATVAGHAQKVHYPWGNEEPDCDKAAYGRVIIGGVKGKCTAKGGLPPPPADSANDVSPLGLLGLAGGLSEWVADDALPFTDPCWLQASLVDARCDLGKQTNKIIRGANYIVPEMVHATTRFVDSKNSPSSPLGFRCAYPAEPAP